MAGVKGNKGGRPKGSTQKPRIADYLSAEMTDKLVAKAYELAVSGSEPMLKLLLEQRFGKAVQPIGNDGNEEFKVTISGMKIIKE